MVSLNCYSEYKYPEYKYPEYQYPEYKHPAISTKLAIFYL